SEGWYVTSESAKNVVSANRASATRSDFRLRCSSMRDIRRETRADTVRRQGKAWARPCPTAVLSSLINVGKTADGRPHPLAALVPFAWDERGAGCVEAAESN